MQFGKNVHRTLEKQAPSTGFNAFHWENTSARGFLDRLRGWSRERNRLAALLYFPDIARDGARFTP